MKPSPEHLAAARAAWYRLRESGPSPVKDPRRYYEGVALAVLAVPKRNPRPLEVKESR